MNLLAASATIQDNLAKRAQTEVTGNNYCHETKNDDCRYNIANHLPAAEPYLVVNTKCLHCAPDTVCKVKPQCNKPNNIKRRINRAAECAYNVSRTVRHIAHYIGLNMHAHHVQNLRQLHLCPEIEEVQTHAKDNNDTKDKHVLRCP